MDFGALNLPMLAAGIAFYGLLALFPALASLIAIWGYIADPSVIEAQFALTQNFIPPEAYTLIERQVQDLVTTNSSTLGWTSVISIGVATWSARLGVSGLMQGLNAAYRRDNRAGLRQLMTAFVITFLLIGVSLAAMMAVVIAPIVLSFFPLGPFTSLALAAARWVIAVALVVMMLSVIYRYGPNRSRRNTRWFSPGIAVAVVIWAAASWAFSFYLSNFANYNEVYGTLGAVIALIIWLYVSAIAVLAGGLMNAEIEAAERRKRERAAPRFTPRDGPFAGI
jgi:membrane protein